MVDKLFVATKAFIINGGKVLLLRESKNYSEGTQSGHYDVPGGRVKPGERFDESLAREIKEETGLTVRIGLPFAVNEWRPNVKGEQWQIVGIFFECFSDSCKVVLSEDHDEFLWINPLDYLKYNNIKTNLPAFEAYLKKNKD